MNRSDKENLNEAYELIQENLMGAIRRTGDRLSGLKNTYQSFKKTGKASYTGLKNEEAARRIVSDAAEDIVKHNMLDQKFQVELEAKLFETILGFLRSKGSEM
jgi:23S rRNA U2552 (ribose-2'-O)-methylase RlmE/FtsJ